MIYVNEYFGVRGSSVCESTDWNICVLGQTVTNEVLVCPANFNALTRVQGINPCKMKYPRPKFTQVWLPL